jgi:hypothetical protein
MPTYEENCKLGRLGELEVMDFFKCRRPDCQIIEYESREDQRINGDFYLTKPNGTIISVEVKTESDDVHNNLFLEEWSNKSYQKVGYMRYSQALILAYFFFYSRRLFFINLRKLQTWCYLEKNVFNYPMKPQGKNKQLNDSWGYCVPIEVCRNLGRVIGFCEYKI